MRLTSFPFVVPAVVALMMAAQVHPVVDGFLIGRCPSGKISHVCSDPSCFLPEKRFGLLVSPSIVRRNIHAFRLGGSKGPGKVERPVNEFSRTYNTDRILGGGPRQRDYTLSVEAEEDERISLAQRFDLSKIYKLRADLSLRREGLDRGARVTGVEVEGTVQASVTQTCVRTNEDFEVDLEFPIFAVVRPITTSSMSTDDDDIDIAALEAAAGRSSDRRNKSKGHHRKQQKDVKSVRTSGDINLMDVMELQRLLQDFDLEDDVVEDEAIYSMNGILDVGELVSQLFWLKLDPYPKKPGTSPIRTSISG